VSITALVVSAMCEPTDGATVLFGRRLPDHVSVSVDGVYAELDPDDPVPDPRPVGRVVIQMPDFVADTFAHHVAALWQFADRVRAESVGPTEQALARALFDAAQSAGYRCPDGDLWLPPAVVDLV
jgi:hypothetical protein